MFHLEGDLLKITLPSGLTQKELVQMTIEEIRSLIESGDLYGKDLRLNGRLTTGMAVSLGHELAHVCKSVSIFDPKENEYILCIKH